MRFLHISDIHFDPLNDGRATRDLRRKFEEYVKEKNITNIDEVFFTGDFRHAESQAKQDPELVAENAINFLLDIARCVGVTDKMHLHIVPGNHDLDRETVSDFNDKNLKKVYKQYEKYDGRFAGYVNDNTSSLEYLRSRFSFFEKCVKILDNQVWTNFNHGLTHHSQNFGHYSILYLNTAIASGRKEDKYDLLIGTDDFEKALQKTGGKPIIVLAHNPLFHLDHDEQNIIKNMFKDNKAPVIWLCGDVHETQYDNSYNTACISAGCMIRQSGTEASFFVGEISRYNEVVISAHGYSAPDSYWQPEEAITKRVNESIPESLKPPTLCDLPKVNNIPERNNYFTGREDKLCHIADMFEKNDKIVIKQTIAGLGGVGKTQLVREFSYRYASYYQTAIWEIDAESPFTVYSDFVKFAHEVNLKLSPDFKEEELCSVIKIWMQNNSNWLIIFDNLEYESVVLPYIPSNNICGHILATTRNTGIDLGQYVDLSVFELDEAIEFLDHRLAGCNHVEKDNEVIKTELVKRLGRLPLALEQAAAYIKVTRTSYSRYLDLLGESGLLAFNMDETKYNKPEYYAKSVTTTWEISFNAVAFEGSKQLFYLCAYLAPDKIPVKLFAEGHEMLPEPMCDDFSTMLNINKIVTELRRFSLTSGDAEYINVHRLVQEVVRDRIKTEDQWLECCIMLFENSYKFEYGSIKSHGQFLELTPHVEVCINAAKLILIDEENQMGMGGLYMIAGKGNGLLGKYGKALEDYQEALKIIKNLMGGEHPYIAELYNSIAEVYECQGEYEKSLTCCEKALAIREKIYGKKHLYTAETYTSIAGVYSKRGEYEKALGYYERALNIQKKILGESNMDTTGTYNDIALAYKMQGKYEKALERYKKVLEIYEKERGKEHPDIATIYSNIAGVYYCQEDYEKTLEWTGQSLKILEKILGKEHPKTAELYSNIAGVYSGQGDYEKALEHLKKALIISKSALGEEHPSTGSTYNNIATVYSRQGKYKKALEGYEKSLIIHRMVLGIEHPYVATTYYNMAIIYLRLEEYDKALEYYENTVKIRKKVLGKEHPDTVKVYSDIAKIYESQGNHEEALAIRGKIVEREVPYRALTDNTQQKSISAKETIKERWKGLKNFLQYKKNK